ncbi:hypothetical protein CFP56_021038 [Quercus suber]|uniref:Uncharacterized protein n=1 Tax=Quercus suber TaxID=58331 RepID=A0AAW0KEZ5_QUESU
MVSFLFLLQSHSFQHKTPIPISLFFTLRTLCTNQQHDFCTIPTQPNSPSPSHSLVRNPPVVGKKGKSLLSVLY